MSQKERSDGTGEQHLKTEREIKHGLWTLCKIKDKNLSIKYWEPSQRENHEISQRIKIILPWKEKQGTKKIFQNKQWKPENNEKMLSKCGEK